MILSRLVTAVAAFAAEYERTEILKLLQQAIQLAASRGPMADAQYHAQVRELKAAAKLIADSDRLAALPEAQKDLLKLSQFWELSPAKFARIVEIGSDSSKQLSASSSEMNLYLNRARSAFQDAAFFVEIARRVVEHDIAIPDGYISLDVTIPRAIYKHDASKIALAQSSFIELMEIIQEFVTGKKDHPKLIYSSTSELVAGFGILVPAVLPFLSLYRDLLQVAKETIDLYQIIRKLSGSGLKVETTALEAQAASINEEGIQKAAEGAIESAVPALKVDEHRKNELRNKVSLRSRVVVRAIINGATVDVTAESQAVLEKSDAQGAISIEEIRQLSKETKEAHKSIAAALGTLNEPVPLRIETDARASDEQSAA